MADFAFVCKSYRGDVARARRLLDSLVEHNPEQIPVVVIVPKDDLALFRETLAGRRHELVSDDDVVASHPQAVEKHLLDRYRATPGYRSQQVVKAEAWRLLGCSAYLCMDSDTVFLRPAHRRDFLAPAGHPYTLLHQSKELLQLAVNRGQARVAEAFCAESARLKAMFGREGPDYDFGPQPLIWSARVWNDLHEKFLAPARLDAVGRHRPRAHRDPLVWRGAAGLPQHPDRADRAAVPRLPP